jgi:hypothetical protein
MITDSEVPEGTWLPKCRRGASPELGANLSVKPQSVPPWAKETKIKSLRKTGEPQQVKLRAF